MGIMAVNGCQSYSPNSLAADCREFNLAVGQRKKKRVGIGGGERKNSCKDWSCSCSNMDTMCDTEHTIKVPSAILTWFCLLQPPTSDWHYSCCHAPGTMIQIIHQFCQTARCKPADIVLEWDTKTGARLTAHGPHGAKTSLNVLCGLNHIAQALLLFATGEEKHYPQMLEHQKQLDAKIREWQAEAGYTTESDASHSPSVEDFATTDWRLAKNPAEVLQCFPARPKPDEIIDLYQLNKTLASPDLANLLRKHSL